VGQIAQNESGKASGKLDAIPLSYVRAAYWPTAIVEPRYLAQIIAGIRRDGLVAR
jgi:hypothetical protein